jgi:hypothetical protein
MADTAEILPDPAKPAPPRGGRCGAGRRRAPPRDRVAVLPRTRESRAAGGDLGSHGSGPRRFIVAEATRPRHPGIHGAASAANVASAEKGIPARGRDDGGKRKRSPSPQRSPAKSSGRSGDRRCKPPSGSGPLGSVARPNTPARRMRRVSPYAIGSRRVGVPVSASKALATAGAIGGTPGSPMPVGRWAEGMICVSTAGMSLIRTTG